MFTAPVEATPVPTKSALPPLPLILSEMPGLIWVVWKPVVLAVLTVWYARLKMEKLLSTMLSTTAGPTVELKLSKKTGSAELGIPADQFPPSLQLVVPALPVQVFCAEEGNATKSAQASVTIRTRGEVWGLSEIMGFCLLVVNWLIDS